MDCLLIIGIIILEFICHMCQSLRLELVAGARTGLKFFG